VACRYLADDGWPQFRAVPAGHARRTAKQSLSSRVPPAAPDGTERCGADAIRNRALRSNAHAAARTFHAAALALKSAEIRDFRRLKAPSGPTRLFLGPICRAAGYQMARIVA
jgi:hypothetical protein